MSRQRRVGEIVSRLLERLKPKAKSVIITIYGDFIAHHGGSAWLGSLIGLTEPLGLNERVVRTSVFRLATEGWLTANQLGRRSYYTVTDSGRRRIEAVHGRIYHHAPRPWDRHWTLVITSTADLDAEQREALRDDLRWLGFGQLAGGVMLHPDPDQAALHQALVGADVARQALVMRATTEAWSAPEAVRGVVDRCWDLKRVAEGYDDFLQAFRPVWKALDGISDLDPRLSFVIRTLLMHAYRRVLLRDPQLPEELLDPEWPGTAARQLCRNLYRLVQAPAERHLRSRLETADGRAPDAHPSYFGRFGGLETPDDAT